MSTGRPKYNENIHENKRVNESIRDVSTNCVAGKTANARYSSYSANRMKQNSRDG